MKEKSVATPCADYEAAAKAWPLPRALMGGTRAMREARTTYLPIEPAEDEPDYERRLARTVLFNGFRKTVRDMAGKVFAKPIAIGEDVPAQAVEWAENIDLAGRNLDVFAHAVLKDGLQAGIGFLLVDMPAALPENATLADEQREGRRPYLVHIKAEQVIGWKSELIGGKETLTQVRIKQCVNEPDGEWHEREVEEIRVLTVVPGSTVVWQTYRKSDKTEEEWIEHASGTTSLPHITLCPVYINRTGFMLGAPPLEDLADLNVAHWQSGSDQRNILHFARVPILFGAGIPQDEKGQYNLKIGSLTLSTDPAAKLSWVEHGGAAINAGRDDLKDLEFQMQVQGLELLIPKPGGQTATGEAIDAAAMHAPLALMATALKDALEQALGYMAEYAGLGDSGGSLTVNTDFGVSMRDAADLTALLGAVNANHITKETFLKELVRRGVLSDDLVPEDEAAKAADEAPDLMGEPMGLGAGALSQGNLATGGPTLDEIRALVTEAVGAIRLPEPAPPPPPAEPPVFNIHVDAPVITMPEQPAPVVNIAPAAVTVEAPVVNVDAGDHAARLMEGMGALVQGVESIAAQQGASNERVAEAMDNLARAQTAPKRLVKDASGKPVGVETITPEN